MYKCLECSPLPNNVVLEQAEVFRGIKLQGEELIFPTTNNLQQILLTKPPFSI